MTVPIDHRAFLPTLAQRLQTWAQQHHDRVCVLISGDPDWSAATAHSLVAGLRPVQHAAWLSARALTNQTRPIQAASRLLGQEHDLVVYDAHSGLDPDGFGAITGTLRGGGFLVLLTPPLEHWPRARDPERERLAIWPHTAAAVGGRFIARFARILRTAPGTIPLLQHDPDWHTTALDRLHQLVADASSRRLRSPMPRQDAGGPTGDPAAPATPDQARAVAAILAVARGRPRRPLVIRAHRGRGKSAALGLAAARLMMGERPLRILVTAPQRAAAQSLFKHATAALGRGATRVDLGSDQGSLTFLAPADLASVRPVADLILIDEAAAIPAPLLAALLAHYPRLVFATTVHGYEGTGRGFEIRFRATLDRLTPNWQELLLETPIRWSAQDPLEALVSRALLLDATPAGAMPDQPWADRGTDPDQIQILRLDRDQLAGDEDRLREIFGLLVLAHYQTRPMDLRMLLDGPNVRIYCVQAGHRILATLLVAAEGPITDPELRTDIFAGRRRPRGHLLPQTLCAHGGLMQATTLRYLRVVRIAVQPAACGCGLARTLLRRLAVDAHREGCDFLGASFGATPELIRFWDQCGFRPAHLGTHRNAASGEHALVVLRPLRISARGFLANAEQRLERRLATLLCGPLRDLDPLTLATLTSAIRSPPPLAPAPDSNASYDADTHDGAELMGFIKDQRGFDPTLPVLCELTRRWLGPCLRAGCMTLEDAALLLAATRQMHPLQTLVQHFDVAGRDVLVSRIRSVAGTLWGYAASHQREDDLAKKAATSLKSMTLG
ncbi:GNAT family N-acetyltransferase [Thiocapsa imhoffii]|uniref:tRNA(Met) cytidine acetyltransferase TmcA n=1 Tax=Thiocapsa imhoffii TaxID=382777 RepID=A0A9X1BA26_9GAMM|nr:GNAT family N-acetyltransferase [Thiocapsa imhoffii]MBK1645665.1 GNAT family N-acetyltransferase [Thiocapsa imhoffii]